MLDQTAPSLAHQVAAFAAAARCDADAAAARNGVLAALEACVLAAIAALLARLQAMVEDWEAGRLAIATPTPRSPGARRRAPSRDARPNAARPNAARPNAPHARSPTPRQPCAPKVPVGQAPVAQAHRPAAPAPHTAHAQAALGCVWPPTVRHLHAIHAQHPARSPKTTRPPTHFATP